MRCGALAWKASVVVVNLFPDVAKIVSKRSSVHSDWTGDSYVRVEIAARDLFYSEGLCAGFLTAISMHETEAISGCCADNVLNKIETSRITANLHDCGSWFIYPLY